MFPIATPLKTVIYFLHKFFTKFHAINMSQNCNALRTEVHSILDLHQRNSCYTFFKLKSCLNYLSNQYDFKIFFLQLSVT